MGYIDKLLRGRKVEWKTLGEVMDVVTDFTAAGSFASNAANVKYQHSPDYALMVRTTDLKNKFSNKQNFVYVNEHAFHYLYRVNLNQESLVLPNVGNCGEIYHVTPQKLPWPHSVLGPNALLLKSNTANLRFLFHLFQASYFQKKLSQITSTVGQTKFNKTNLKTLPIPLPPLDVQVEIARVLDRFTALEAELEAELEARQKQYEYYRDRLLTFDKTRTDVEWKTLGEVAEYEQPSKYLVHSTKYNDSFPTPVLTAGKSFILGYTGESSGIYRASEAPIILFDDFTTASRWVDFNFKVKSSATKIITSGDEGVVLLKYIYYWLNTLPSECVEGDHKRRWISTFTIKKIPIPPLAEQERIVRILDKFSTLTTSLTAGLPREIALRRRQYEYYREQLLSFE